MTDQPDQLRPDRDLEWPSEDLAQAGKTPSRAPQSPDPAFPPNASIPPNSPTPPNATTPPPAQPEAPFSPAPPPADAARTPVYPPPPTDAAAPHGAPFPTNAPLPPAPQPPEAAPPPAFLPPPYPEYDERRPPPMPAHGSQPFTGPAPILTPRDQGPYAITPDSSVVTPEPAPEQKRRGYFRPDIEGLRAIAVIAVLLFHVGIPLTAGGYVGVDVFYVISGFLITGLLLREGETTGKVDLVGFYARRMRRLLPAALVVIVVTLALSAVIVTPLRLNEIAVDAIASALYMANFLFAYQATDYLAIDVPSPLQHYWTLGVEEQFYLVWPLIMLVASRLLSPRFIGVFIAVLAIASFGLSLYWTDAAPAWAFFSPFTRGWELAAGALVAVGLLRIPRRAPGLVAPTLVILGLGLIVASVVMFNDLTPFPGVAALLPVSGAVLIIVGGIDRPTRPARWLLANPVSRYVGRISYSLYLWHWPILVLIPIALGSDELVLRIGLAWVAIVVAAISTEVIEQPFRRSGALSRRPGGSVRLGLAASAAVAAVALLMSGIITLPTSLVRPDPVTLELAAARQDLPVLYSDGCHVFIEVTEPADCAYGDPDGLKTAVLFGDSHAGHWFPALDAYARDKGWRLEVHAKSACSPVPVDLFHRKLRRVYDECTQWRNAVVKRIGKIRPEVVFVGSSRDYDIQDGTRLLQVRQIYPFWEERLTEMVRSLGQRARRVVLLAETPYLNFDPIDCLADGSASSCDPARILSVDADYEAIEADAAANGGADLLNINDVICPGLSCPVVVDGIVVYRDSEHLTGSYMEHLSEPIANMIEGRAPFPTPLPSADPGAVPA